MFYVTRHGQTSWNIEGLYQGDTDTLLTEEGLRQAERLRDYLAETPIDRIVCSTLRRAKITAETVNERHHAPILYTEKLIERGFGKWEGSSIAEHKNDPEKPRFPYLSETDLPYGIESAAAMCARVFSLLRGLEETYPGRNILIVTHGGTIGAVNAYFRGFGEDGKRMMQRMTGNCRLLIYDRREDAGGAFPEEICP